MGDNESMQISDLEMMKDISRLLKKVWPDLPSIRTVSAKDRVAKTESFTE